MRKKLKFYVTLFRQNKQNVELANKLDNQDSKCSNQNEKNKCSQSGVN